MKKEYHLKPFYRSVYFFVASIMILGIILKFPDHKLIGVSYTNWLINTIAFTIMTILALCKALFDKLTISDDGIEYWSLSLSTYYPWEKVKHDMLITKSTFTLKRGIPLYLFTDNPIDSEIGQQIKQHAPHLFEKEKSAQSV
ncbi:MAG: hypothetical protein ACOYZ6_06445 [Chloroflexota bacterium]